MNTNTPRTDNAIGPGYDLGDAIDPDFARQLEQEVNILEAALKQISTLRYSFGSTIYEDEGECQALAILTLREVERLRKS